MNVNATNFLSKKCQWVGNNTSVINDFASFCDILTSDYMSIIRDCDKNRCNIPLNWQDLVLFLKVLQRLIDTPCDETLTTALKIILGVEVESTADGKIMLLTTITGEQVTFEYDAKRDKRYIDAQVLIFNILDGNENKEGAQNV